MIPAEHDRDRAGLGDREHLAVDHRVGPIDPGRHDVRVTSVDDGQHLERLDAELQRVDRARRVLRLADRAPGRWLTASSNGAPTIATSIALLRSSAGSTTQGRFMKVGMPTYVGRSK